eukprot:snap_masked-scaffold_16-processed-gene-1.52-mRNA-1 protein AED:0.06 eAED:0.06 QI:0/0/0/1/1/1/3/0/364
MSAKNLSVGLVGVANIGKSTIFNTLIRSELAVAANYPFCTIEPKVIVKDSKLDKLSTIGKSNRTIYRTFELVDIAGLVKGASEGKGLGNQFLANIREVDAIFHVLRCFSDPRIVQHEGNTEVDPLSDLETIQTELALADLTSVEKRLTKVKDKQVKSLLENVQNQLSENLKLDPHSFSMSKVDIELATGLQFLTLKPVLYICNVSENFPEPFNAKDCNIGETDDVIKEVESVLKVTEKVGEENVVYVSAADEEANSLLNEDYEPSTGVRHIFSKVYNLLNLDVFYTVGEQEARAWSIQKDSTAQKSAGVIHSDFEKKFISAEVISYHDFLHFEGREGCKINGKLRLEGRDYVMNSGDVVEFRHN